MMLGLRGPGLALLFWLCGGIKPKAFRVGHGLCLTFTPKPVEESYTPHRDVALACQGF